MNEDCPFCLYEKTETNCPGCWEGSNYKPKPMTNADRIRAMTDEELAEFLYDCSDHPSLEWWKAWAKQADWDWHE